MPGISTSPDKVFERLREGILSGAYPGGTVLRQEEVASRLGVSRMPVREAFRQLAAEGFVILTPHRGAVVSELSVTELRELFEMRAALEPLALRLALPHLTREHLGRAEDALIAAERQSDGAQLSEQNRRFHLSLYAPCQRPRLYATIETLHLNLDRYMRLILTALAHQGQSQLEHRELLEACQRGDAPQALAILERHISGGEQFVQVLEQAQEAL